MRFKRVSARVSSMYSGSHLSKVQCGEHGVYQ